MKKFAMLCAVVWAIGGSAFAQSITDTVTLQTDRPVMVNRTEFPAGHLTIQLLGAIGGGNVALVVRSDSGTEAGVLVSRLHHQEPNSGPEVRVKLIRHGNEYYLDQVWLSENVGFQLLQPFTGTEAH